MKLKQQLLLIWLVSMLFALLLMGGIFFSALERFHQDNARSQMLEGFRILRGEFLQQRDKLLQQTKTLSHSAKLIASLNFISRYQDSNAYEPLVFDVEKQTLSSLLRQSGRVSGLRLLAVYTTQGELSSFCVFDKNQERCAYTSYAQGEPYLAAFPDAKNTDTPAVEAPAFLQTAPHYPAMADSIEFALRLQDRHLALEAKALLMRRYPNGEQQPVGLVRALSYFDQHALTHVSSQINLALSLFYQRQLVLGDWPSSEALPEMRNAPYLMDENFAAHPGTWLSNENYFFGGVKIRLSEEDDSLFLFRAEKRHLASELAQMQRALIWVLIATALLLIPLGLWLLTRILSKPVEQLARAVQALQGGHYVRLAEKPGNNELALLARGFNSMTETLRQREEKLLKLSAAIEQSPVSVIITDTQGVIEYVNPKFEELTGYSFAEASGKKPSILKSGRTSEQTYRDIWSALKAGRSWQGELYNRKKNGQFFWEFARLSPIRNHRGEITHLLAVKEDISTRKRYEERLLHQAHHDSLTGLPNRLLALDRLKQALVLQHRYQGVVGLLFIDLDQFKHINDSMSHETGDQLLMQLAERLSSCLREEDTLARQGGDEFLLILPRLRNAAEAELVAQKLLRMTLSPFRLPHYETVITASIGITIAPDDGEDAHDLLRNADAAMYRAKAAGRNTYRFFTPEMNRRVTHHLQLESQLRRALEKNEMEVHYQPQIALQNQKMVSVEALLRWHNPLLGQVSPGEFIPIAESNGQIEVLGNWVLQTACRHAQQWRVQNGSEWRVAVNVSAQQFRREHLLENIEFALQDSALPPHLLELEVTESLLLDDLSHTLKLLQQVKDMGIQIALDDFGTGYSSLSYLKRFPFDRLKIDRSFVCDVTHDSEAAALTVAIINMAHSLGLEVLAEGVETHEQLLFLQRHQCDLCQGFYFSRAIPQNQLHQISQQLRK